MQLDDKLRQIKNLGEENKNLEQLHDLEHQKMMENHQSNMQQKDQKIFNLK